MINGNINGKALASLALVISQIAHSPQTPLNGTIPIPPLAYVREIPQVSRLFYYLYSVTKVTYITILKASTPWHSRTLGTPRCLLLLSS